MTALTATQLAVPQALTASVNGAAADVRDLTGVVKFILNSSIPASGQTSDVKIQGSANGSSGWADTGLVFPQLTNASTSGFLTIDANVDELPRYLRAVNTIAGAGTVTFAALVGGKAGVNR